MNSRMTVRYLGHSCFLLDYRGCGMVLDPYSDGSVPGLKNVRVIAQGAFCSHDHADHNNKSCYSAVDMDEPGDIAFEAIETDHDPLGGTLRGKNTVRIFTCGDLRVAHLGDLGRPLKPEEIEKLRGLDLLLIPVGGFFTIDAKQAKKIIEQLTPRVTVPMHYRTGRSGYDVIASLDKVLKVLGPATMLDGPLELSKETPPGLYVMRAENEIGSTKENHQYGNL